MLRKMFAALAALTVLVSFSACSSFQSGRDFNGCKLTTDENRTVAGVVNAEIWGIYLFDMPLFTGSSVSTGKCAMFNDTVTVGNVMKLMTRESSNFLKADYLVDVQTERTSNWIFFTGLFWYKSVQASGTALR